MRAEAVDDHLSADRYEDRPGQPAPAAAARITSRGVIISGPPHCTPQRPPPTVASLMDSGPQLHAASEACMNAVRGRFMWSYAQPRTSRSGPSG